MPLAIPRSVDFPDPFSPTTAWISPARQSTLASRSAWTAPNRFETSRSERTTGLAGPGFVDTCLVRASPSLPMLGLRVHLPLERRRDQRRRRAVGRNVGPAGGLRDRDQV